jgi:hypothetical protein
MKTKYFLFIILISVAFLSWSFNTNALKHNMIICEFQHPRPPKPPTPGHKPPKPHEPAKPKPAKKPAEPKKPKAPSQPKSPPKPK